MTLSNATPHKINIISSNGVEQDPKTKQFTLVNPELLETIKVIEPSGILPRVSMVNQPSGEIDGVPVQSVEYGDIQGLPEEVEGVFYIVSGLVAAAAGRQGRKDCLAPGALVRDAANPSIVVGCLFLQKP